MLETCFQRGWPYYEYHSFRKELAKHADNWCSDLDTLHRMAKEEWNLQLQTNELRPAILARVPAETAMEWGYHSSSPLVAVCVFVEVWCFAGKMAGGHILSWRGPDTDRTM